MSDFSIDIELSLSKSEREAMAVLDRLEKQIERLNKSIKIVTSLDTSGIDAQVKVIQQKFAAGKVSVGLPDDKAIAAFETARYKAAIATNQRIAVEQARLNAQVKPVAQAVAPTQGQPAVAQTKVTGSSTATTAATNTVAKIAPTSDQKPFPTSIELGSQSLNAIRNLQVALINAIDKSGTKVADASRQSVLKSIASIAGGQLASNGIQNVVSNKAVQQAALDKAQAALGGENFQKASDAFKGLIADQPLLQKLKDSTDNLVTSLRSIEGVEPLIQASKQAFESMKSAIDRVKAEFASLSEKVGFTAKVQEAYRIASDLTSEAIGRMAPVIDAVKARITALDERFEISAKIQSLTDAATSAYALTIGVLVDKISALNEKYRITEDAMKDFKAALEFSKGVAKDFAEDVSGRITALKGVFNGIGDILAEEFAALLSTSPKLLSAFTALEGVFEKIPFAAVTGGFAAIGTAFAELKNLAVDSFDFGFIIAFQKLDVRQDIIGKIDAAAESVVEFAKSVKAKGLEIKESLIDFAIDNNIVATYKNFADEAALTANRLVSQFAEIRGSSAELRGVLGEVGDKYQGLSNLTGLAANSLKVFEINVGGVIPFLKQFDGVASGAVVGLSLLEQALENLKKAALATQIKAGGLSLDVEVDPALKGLPSLLLEIQAGLGNLKGRLFIDNLVESMTLSRELLQLLEQFDKPRNILIGSSDISGALVVVNSLESQLKRLTAVESKLNLNYAEIIEAEVVSERLLLASARLRSEAPLLLKAASPDLDRIQQQIQSVTSLDLSTKPLSIDGSSLAGLQKQIAGLTVTVTATQNFQAIEEAYKVLRALVLDLAFSVTPEFGQVVELGRALKTIQSIIASINSTPIVLLSSTASLTASVAELRDIDGLIKSIASANDSIKIAPSIDRKSVATDLSFYDGKTIEVKAVPVFEGVYEAYRKLDETVVNLPFRIDAYPEFDAAFTQLKQLDSAIDGIKKESKLVLTADGLEGSVAAFQAVEASIKGVVSAMDSAARLSNQSLSTLKSAVEATPAGGDLRTKAPFVAQSLIEQEKLAEQSLKRLKALAADLKIEPLGNKSTKAAYITAIEEFITAGGQIGDAWKRTEDTFEDVAKQMKKVAGETGASMVQDMNHSAADTVAAAWKRTEGTFDGVTKSMVNSGKSTAEELVKVFEASFKAIEAAIVKLQAALAKTAAISIEIPRSEDQSSALKSVVSDADKLIKASVGISTGVKTLSAAVKGGDVMEIGGALAGLADSASKLDVDKIKGMGSALKGLGGAAATKATVDDVGKLIAVSTGIATAIGTLTTALNGGDVAAIGASLTALTAAASSIDIGKIKGMGVALKGLGAEGGGIEKLKDELFRLDEVSKGSFASGWVKARAAFQASTDGIMDQAHATSKVLTDSLSGNSAEIVTAAWKRTNKAFHISTDDMVVQAQATGAELVDNLNHRAADTTGNAWKRTLKTFKGVVGDMSSGAAGAAGEINTKFKQVELVAKSVGAEIAFAINSASKKIEVDADFKKAIDKTREAVDQIKEKIASIRPPQFDDVLEGSTNGIRSLSGGFDGLIDRVIAFKNNPPPFKEMAASAAGAVAGVALLTGGILALVTAVKASIEFARTMIRAWMEATAALVQGGQKIFEVWRDTTGVLIQGATATVDAWKTASSAIITTGQSIVSTWQSVTSSVISGGKQLFDTWKGATDAVTGFAATSVKAYADVETSIKAVSGILDLSTKQSEELFNSVQETGQDASNKFSTKKIAELAATLAKGGKQVDEIKQLLSPISTGATAIGEEDLAKFGGNFLDVIGKFNIPLKDSNKAVELYVKTLTSAKLDAAAFANTIKYANVEKEGVEGLKDLAAQTVAFAQVGTRGSKVGTDVNRVMTELAIALEGTSKKAERQRDILKELGLAEEFAGDKAKDVVNRLPALAKAFNDLEKETGRDNAIAKFNELLGTKGTQAILSFSKVSAEKFQEVRASLDKVADGSSGVVKKFASLAVAGVSGAIVTLENNLETVQASLGKSLSKTVAGFATIATSILSTIGGPTSPVFKALTAVGEKVEKLFSVGGKGEELAAKIGKAFEGLATKGVSVFADTIGNVVEYFSDTKNINEFTKRIEYLGYVFVEVYKIATQLIGGFAAVAFQIVGAVQAFSQSSSGQALGAGMNTAFTTIATGGASLLEGKLQSIQSYFSDQTNVNNFTNALQFVGKAALIAYSSLTDMLATMYRMSVAAIGIVDVFSKTDVGAGFFKSLTTGFQDLSEQAIALTTKRLQEFSDHLQKGDNAAQFAAQLKSIGELSLFAYDGLTQAVAGLANIGLQAAKTTNDFIKSQEGVALIDRLSTTFKKVGAEANNLIQKGLGQVFEYLSRPEVSMAIENIALGFLKLYDGLTRIVGIGFDGLLKLGSALGAFFSSPKGQSTIDRLVEGFAKLMDVGIGFLLEQLDKFTAWANEPGNLGELVDLLKSAAELWLQNYISLTKFNLEMAAFSINVTKGLAAFAKALQFKDTLLLDTAGTLAAIDEMTNKLAGFRLYSEEQARMDKERSASSNNFFAGATEAFMATLAPAIINIKAAVEDFIKNGAPALGQIFATIGVSLGLIVQVLGNAIALVIRVVTAALPIINVILQPILGFINLIAGVAATAFSQAVSGFGLLAGILNTFLSGTLDPIAKFVGGLFNGGIKNMGVFSIVVAQGFSSLEKIISPIVEFIAESFTKLPENVFKIFGAVKDTIQSNLRASLAATSATTLSISKESAQMGLSLGSAFEDGKNAAVSFGESLKSGVIAKIEETKQFGADVGQGMAISWGEATKSMRSNYDDFALNFGVTSQQTDQFFTDLNNGITKIWNDTTGALTAKWNEFTGFFTAKSDETGAKWNETTGMLSAAWTAVVDAMSAKWNEFSAFVSSVWSATMAMIQPYLDALVAGFNAAVGMMSAAWNSFTAYLSGAWNGVVNAIVAGFQAAMNAVGGIAQNTGNALIGFFTQAANAIGSVFAQIGQGITAFFQPAVDAVNNIVEKLSQARSFGDGVGQVLSGKAFQGARADGGPVTGGAGAYLVGERGPEIFVPKTDGYIVPNHAIDGFRAEGGPVSAGKTYVVGEIGTEAFIPGSGKKSASFTLDFTSAITPLLGQVTRAGDHLNTIALGIKNIQQNAYSIASQTKKGFAEVIAKIPAGGLGGGFQLPNLGGFGGFSLPGANTAPSGAASSITAAFKAKDIAGIEAGLVAAAQKAGITDKAQLAYLLATAKHESDNFATLTEYASGADYEGRDDLGNNQSGDGVRFKGRGFVQLTGRANYAKYSKKLGIDLIKNPELAADPEIAARILADGMLTGAYTGRKLNDYGKGSGFNAVGARAIVNGSDRAGQIAGYSNDYSGKIDGIVQKANAIAKGDGGTVTQLPGTFGTATGSTKVAGTLPKLSVSSLGVGSAQEYGASRDGGARRHAGQDIDVFYTDPAEGKMYSMLGGIVVKNWEDPKDYFNYTDIYNPGQNLIERIAERGPSQVREGQEVKPGDVVSKGVAGQASAIHYEIRKVQKDAASKYGVSAVSPGLGSQEGTYDPIKKLEELGLGSRSGSTFTGSGQVLSSNGGGGGQSSGGGSFSLPGASILTYEQFAGQKGDGGTLTQLPGSISTGAAQAAAPIVNLPTFTLPKTVSGKGGTKEVAAKIDPQKLKVALKSNDVSKLEELYNKSKGQATVTAKLLPKTIQDIYGLSGTEEVKRDQIGALLINLKRLTGSANEGAFNASQASLGITSAEFKKAADLATEASSKGVDIPVELLGADFKKAIGKTTGSVKAVEVLKVLSELKTADPQKYASVSSAAIDRISYIASLSDGERKNLDELVARLERDKRDRVVASELPDAVRKLLGVKSGDESVAVDRIKNLIKEIGELPISLPADLETALASLSERELKNAIETIKDAQRAGDKAIFASSLTPELRKGLGLKPSAKIDIAKLTELLPVLEGRLSKIAGGKELSRLEQILKFNKVNLPSGVLDKFEKQYTKVIEAQKFDLKSLGQDEVNALEKLGVLKAGALGVGESYIDEAKLQRLYGDGATIADAVNGTVKAVGDANAAIVKAQEAFSSAVATSTDKLPPVPVIPQISSSVNTEAQSSVNPQINIPSSVLDSLDSANLSTASPKATTQTKTLSDRIREIATKTGQDAFAIQAELQRQGLKAIGAVGGAGVLPTITEIQSALKSSASFTQASPSATINDRIREIIERTGLDAFKIQDELEKQGLKAIGAVGGKGTLPTIAEIRKILDTGLQKPVIQAAVSAGLPAANVVKPFGKLAVEPPDIVKPFGKLAVEPPKPTLTLSDLRGAGINGESKPKSNPILEAAKKVGSDAFKIQAELEKQGLKAIGAVGGKGILPTIAEIQKTLNTDLQKPVNAQTSNSSIQDRIQEIAKRTNGDAFAIQKELEKGGLRAIGAVGGTGTLPTIAEIQKIVKAGNAEISKSVTASLPTTPPAITDSIADALGVDAKIFTGTDLKDPFAIQKALEKAGYKSIGALGADGKTVKAGATNELPTIDRIRKAVDGAMDANKGIVSAIASSTTATLDVVQAQTSDIESQIAKLYGVDATGLTGLSGFALATEIQKRVQAKGGRAVGGANSTKANELPTISEINSKLVDLSKAIDTKQQAATSPTTGTAGAPGTIVSSPTAPAQKKFEFKFGGTGDTASREEVEGKLKQFEQYLNSDEFLAVAVEMVLSALKNDSRARLFSGLL